MGRHLPFALAFALGACGPGKATVDTIPAAQIQYCVDTLCAKPLICHKAIEPTDDFEERCWQGCTNMLERAEAEDCGAELQAMLACADAAACDPYLDWWLYQQADSVCSSEEQALLDACPDLHWREP